MEIVAMDMKVNNKHSLSTVYYSTLYSYIQSLAFLL